MDRNNVVLVDIFDNEKGIMSKTLAHKSPNLHRAFSVFLYHDNKMLIQKRAASKYHSPNKWANACCSHPRSKENIKESAIKRLKEELNVSCNIEELYSFIYMSKYNDDLFEYELDHVFIGEYNGEVKLDKNEASEYKWIDIKELSDDLVNNPNKYATWFIICAPIVIKELLNK